MKLKIVQHLTLLPLSTLKYKLVCRTAFEPVVGNLASAICFKDVLEMALTSKTFKVNDRVNNSSCELKKNFNFVACEFF